jgi:prophage tail gpP-like protein
LSTTYKTIPGDTFSLIARKQIGDDQKANIIAKGNPGAVEPLVPGTNLTIPALPESAPIVTDFTDPNETQIRINNERFRFFSALRLSRAIDNLDTFDFQAPFNSKDPKHRAAFEPMAFHTVDITVGPDVIFTGTLMQSPITSTTSSTIVNGSCYALPGVLADCPMPASAYPLEMRKLTIEQIAKTMLEPFGLGVIFEADPGPVFDKVAPKPTQRVLPFLSELAHQRGLIISNTPQGNLLFLQSVQTGNPVATLKQGETPLVGVVPSLNSQAYYSDVTALKPRKVGSKGSKFTVQNKLIGPVLRPYTFQVRDAKKADTTIAANAKIGRMFGNSVQYRITLDTWRDPQDSLWTPNTTIVIQAPDSKIYDPYEFLIRSVVLNKDSRTEVATLNVTLPGAFSGEIPEAMPWAI